MPRTSQSKDLRVQIFNVSNFPRTKSPRLFDKIWLWISNFLKQRVVVDGIQSDLVTVDSGVPQGTVLGPILFLLHINDLPSVISSKVRLFADDCLVHREIKNRQDQIALQKDLNMQLPRKQTPSCHSWGATWRAVRKKLRETAYFALVRSFLEYSATVWHLHQKYNSDKLEMVQRYYE